MKLQLDPLMLEAMRLTQAGDLTAATAAIQSALNGSRSGHAQATPSLPPRTAMPRGDVIDIDAVTVPDQVAAAPAAGVRADAPGSNGAFVAGSQSGRHGQRDYKLYIPPQAADALQPLPLLVMLHGCTQDADDFAAGTAMNNAARERGFYVLYPQQSARANPQRCWNWFKHSHQTRTRGEPALIADMVATVRAAHAIDPARIWVAGLSAGGAMAAILARTHPDLFAAAGVHSGLAAGAAGDLPSAMLAMRQGAAASVPATETAASVPTIVFHGDADATVDPVNGRQVFAAARAVDADPEAPVGIDPPGRRGATRRVSRSADGSVQAEHWLVHGAPHAWSGGSSKGSYTDPRGPDATGEMVRFFYDHPRTR